jgi:hypothetical protein
MAHGFASLLCVTAIVGYKLLGRSVVFVVDVLQMERSGLSKGERPDGWRRIKRSDGWRRWWLLKVRGVVLGIEWKAVRSWLVKGSGCLLKFTYVVLPSQQ